MEGIFNGLISLDKPELASFTVVVLQDLGGSMVDTQAIADRFRFIVLTGGNFTAAEITDAF